MRRPIKNVCCIGAGYVGSPTCAVIALKNAGIRVTVVDTSESRIDAWNSQNLPFYEPGLDEIIEIVRDGDGARQPNLIFSSDVESAIRDAELILIAVNTPTKTTGLGAGRACDLAFVEAAARQIAEVSTSDKIVVEKSTVPCGTASRLADIFSELGDPNVNFEILSNPEFLSEGTAIKDLLEPDRVLIGSDQTRSGDLAADALKDIYASWVPRKRIINTNVASSEIAKLAANCMLAQRISSVNSLSALCESEGAVIDELTRAVGLDDRVGPHFLKASVGFGGSCFKKDVLSLVYMAESRHLDEVAAYWRSVVELNEWQKRSFTGKVVSTLNGTLAGKKIAVLGYAYKKNTSDTRESAAISVVEQLVAENAKVQIYDPKVAEMQIRADLRDRVSADAINRNLTFCSDAYAACTGAAAILVLTEWDLFKIDSDERGPRKAFNGDEASPNGAADSSDSAYDSAHDSAQTTDSEDQGSCSQHERLNWKKIASLVRKPRYVFDGRNIVNPHRLRAIGFNVVNLGNWQTSLTAQ